MLSSKLTPGMMFIRPVAGYRIVDFVISVRALGDDGMKFLIMRTFVTNNKIEVFEHIHGIAEIYDQWHRIA